MRHKEVKLQPYTLELFEVLERHGMLSSLYLRQFFPRVDEYLLLHHLQELAENGYLERPPSLNPPHVFNDYKVYCMRDKARRLINVSKGTKLTGDNRHKLMTGVITATIELGVKANGWTYVSQ